MRFCADPNAAYAGGGSRFAGHGAHVRRRPLRAAWPRSPGIADAAIAIAAKAAARNVFLLSIMHLLLVFLF